MGSICSSKSSKLSATVSVIDNSTSSAQGQKFITQPAVQCDSNNSIVQESSPLQQKLQKQQQLQYEHITEPTTTSQQECISIPKSAISPSNLVQQNSPGIISCQSTSMIQETGEQDYVSELRQTLSGRNSEVNSCDVKMQNFTDIYVFHISTFSENIPLRRKLLEELYPIEREVALRVVDLGISAKDQFTSCGVMDREVSRLKIESKSASTIYTIFFPFQPTKMALFFFPRLLEASLYQELLDTLKPSQRSLISDWYQHYNKSDKFATRREITDLIPEFRSSNLRSKIRARQRLACVLEQLRNVLLPQMERIESDFEREVSDILQHANKSPKSVRIIAIASEQFSIFAQNC